MIFFPHKRTTFISENLTLSYNINPCLRFFFKSYNGPNTSPSPPIIHIIIETIKENVNDPGECLDSLKPYLSVLFMSHMKKLISTHRMQFSYHHGLGHLSGVCGVTHVLKALRGVSSSLLS